MAIRRVGLLLLEDSLVQSEGLMNLFANEYEEVRFLPVVARTLEEAVTLLKAGQIDCVIADLSLPDSDGVKTIMTIKQASSVVPIFVLTGMSSSRIALELFRVGVEDYMEKGRDFDILRAVRFGLERFWARQLSKSS